MTTENPNLDDALYRRHFSAISSICETSRLSLVRTYWRIGRYITEQSRVPAESGYGSGLLRRLSGDLTAGYGRGFSLTNLKNMRLFYRTYEYQGIRESIEWSGYVLLLTVRDPDLRREIETRIVEESLNHYQIRKTIAAQRLARRLSRDQGYRPSPLPGGPVLT